MTRRQEEIIKIAVNLIAEGGIQNFTIKQLSKRVGVSEAAIYRHFKNKQDILINILNLFNNNENQIAKSICTQNISNAEKLRKILCEHIDFFSKNQAIAAVIFSEGIFNNDKLLSSQIYDIIKANQEIIVKIISDGQKNNEFRTDITPDTLALMIIGSLRLLVTQWRLDNFSFDLIGAGEQLCNAMDLTIKK